MKAWFFLCFISLFLSSCAQKLERKEGDEDSVTIYSASEIKGKNPYMTCSPFADQTFRGKVWFDPNKPFKDCFVLTINKTPNSFLKNEDLFLQIYPFQTNDEGFQYGSSIRIQTFEKSSKEEKKILMESNIIDTFLVETELELEPDYFFLDHFFKLCELDSKWQGLQLVIYQRKDYQEDAVPLRTTKVLLPPFFVHPGHFKEKKGEILATYHPFMSKSLDLKSDPSTYYDFAEETCADAL